MLYLSPCAILGPMITNVVVPISSCIWYHILLLRIEMEERTPIVEPKC